MQTYIEKNMTTRQMKLDQIAQGINVESFLADEDTIIRRAAEDAICEEKMAQFKAGENVMDIVKYAIKHVWLKRAILEHLQIERPWWQSVRTYEIYERMAELGMCLNALVYSKYEVVRLAVAKQGYGLDILANDEDEYIRVAVAEQGYGLDVLVNDKSEHVRRAVAQQGYGLDVLVYDEDALVRLAVAKQGYGWDILINDEYDDIRDYITEYNDSGMFDEEYSKANMYEDMYSNMYD